MPLCLRDAETRDSQDAPEWHEPPGYLGEYVRRVKRMKAADELARRADEMRWPRQ